MAYEVARRSHPRLATAHGAVRTHDALLPDIARWQFQHDLQHAATRARRTQPLGRRRCGRSDQTREVDLPCKEVPLHGGEEVPVRQLPRDGPGETAEVRATAPRSQTPAGEVEVNLPHHRHLRRHKANGWQREEGRSLWVDLLVIAVLIEIGVLLYGWFAH